MQGGAIYAGRTSMLSITDSFVAHNTAPLFGPAILDLSMGSMSASSNTGCNNTADEFYTSCDGSLRALDGVDVCGPFETICEVPTSLSRPVPTSEPSMYPFIVNYDEASPQPTQNASLQPSVAPTAQYSQTLTQSPSSSYSTTNETTLSIISGTTSAPAASPDQYQYVSSEIPTLIKEAEAMEVSVLEETVSFSTSPSIAFPVTSTVSLPVAFSEVSVVTSSTPSSTFSPAPSPFTQGPSKDTVSSLIQEENEFTGSPTDVAIFDQLSDEGMFLVPTQLASSTSSQAVLEVQPGEPLVQDKCPALTFSEPLPGNGAYVQGIAPKLDFDSSALQTCRTQRNNVQGNAWFSLIGNGSTMTAHTCSFFFESFQLDTQIEIYLSARSDPNCMEPLQCVIENDDFCGQQSLVNWFAEKDRVYFILVRGSRPTQATEIGLEPHFSLTLAPTPGGSCDTPIAIVAEPSTGELELVDDISGMDLLHTRGSIFYMVIGTGNWLMADACQRDEPLRVRLRMFRESCDGNPDDIAEVLERSCGSGQLVTWLSEPGVHYYIEKYRVDSI